MCGLCSQDEAERKLESKKIEFIMKTMDELRRHYEGLLGKTIMPHTEEDKTAKYRARRLIKLLVDEWL